jgi:uncharacterized lipoprotein YajG
MRIISCVVGVVLLLAGCAGTGDTIPLNIQALPSVRTLNQNFQDIKVVVERFEEDSDAARLGVRTHLGGGETVFTARGGKTGEVVAQVVADNLKSMGFQVWVKKSAVSEVPAKPDITITGQVQQLSVQARSRFFSTKMTAKVKVVIQAANVSDHSTVRLNLDGAREEAVFWFEPVEVQELVNRMLKENLDRILADIRVQDRALLTK